MTTTSYRSAFSVFKTFSKLWLILAFGSSLMAQTAPQNVILFIGDGMGPEQVKAANFYNGGPLSFESLPNQGEVTTNSADNAVTDSAAAATAIATGVKVNNGVISLALPGNGSELETLLEMYAKRGKKTALITTAYLTHATPAGFGAHETNRGNYTQIGADLLNQTRPNILFGGGGNGLDAAATAASGYSVATDTAGFGSLNLTGERLAGLFGTAYMPYEEDYLSNPGSYPYPHLSDMVTKALDALEDHSDGFFLMVEAGRIDHACHSNLLPETVHEALELGNAVQAAINWISTRTDTLMIVTADHETGGLNVLDTTGTKDSYPAVSWGSKSHSGVNVPVYAVGTNADQLTTVMDNTDFVRLCTLEGTTQPILYRVSVQDLTDSSATIVWATDEAADSVVEYREAGSGTWLTATDTLLTTTHSVPLSALTPGLIYEYRVSSYNGSVTNYSATYPLVPVFDPGAPLTLIAEGADWKYLDNGSDQGTAWKEPSFNDSGWAVGPAELGYGDGGEATLLSYGDDSNNKYRTTYFRHTINVVNPAAYGGLSLRLLRDDGAVVYLNGIEIHRVNMANGTILYDTFAEGAADYPWDNAVTIPNTLIAGDNVLAVEIHQGNATSSDLSFDLELTASDPNDVQIVKGPWLQNVTENSMVVMWETDAPIGSRVDYGLGSADELQVVDDTPVTIHQVTLTGLSANTSYSYTVSSGYAVSTEVSFATAPTPGASDSFRFAVYGDTRTNSADHSAVVNAMMLNTPLPRFVLHVGDLVESGQIYSEWETQFFTPGAELFSRAPLFPILGNHEYSGTGQMWYFDFFNLPDNGTGLGLEEWYAFTYGNVRIVALNSNGDYTPGSDQHDWLTAELAASEFQSATWRIVFFHHPPYSDRPNLEVQTDLVPLFHQHGVHLVFNGHDHNYRHVERLDPTHGTTISYIVTGGGGAPLTTPGDIASDPALTEFVKLAALHHCILDVTPTSLLLNVQANDATIIDSLQLNLEIDTTPPVIAAVSAITTDTTATITWTSDEAATSLGDYRIAGETEWTTVSETDYVTSHSLMLNGLTEKTLYEYQVTSADTSGNSVTDPGPPHVFTTLETNLAPVADNQPVSLNEDTPTVITLTGSDPNTGDTLAYTVVLPPSHGTLDIVEANVTYTPDADYNGPDSFLFVVSDGTLDSDAATVSITVTAVDDGPPSAPTGLTATADNDQILLNWLPGIDPDGEQLTYSVFRNGTEIAAGLTGTSYPDTTAATNTAYTYIVRAVDNAALFSDSSPIIFENDTIAPALSSISANPSQSGTAAAVTWTTNEAATSRVNYRKSGEEDWQSISDPAMVTDHSMDLGSLDPAKTYDYQVTSTDAAGNSATSTPIIFTTRGVIPTANPIEESPVNVGEDASVEITLTGTDPNGDPLTFTIASGPSHATLTPGTSDLNWAKFTYEPDPDYDQDDSFEFTVSDGTYTSPPATVLIEVTPVDDPPSAPANLIATAGDSRVDLSWQAATDPDTGDGITYSVYRDGTPVATGLTVTSYLDASLVNDTKYSYVVRTIDSFGLYADSAPVAATPQGIDPNAYVTQNPAMITGTRTGDEFSSLGIANDGASQTLSEIRVGRYGQLEAQYVLQTVANPALVDSLALHLTYSLSADDTPWRLLVWNGSAWTPLADLAEGTHTIAIPLDRATAMDQDGTIRISIMDGGDVRKEKYDSLILDALYADVTIGTPNSPPTADSSSATTPEDSPLAITLTGSDPEVDPLTYSVVVAPTHGSLSGTLPDLTYTPDGDYSGSDSFQFVANDGRSDSPPATVTISISPLNDLPLATPQSVSTEVNTPVVITLEGSDADGDPLTYEITVATSHGSTGTLSGNQVTYTPDPSYVGDDSFVYEVADGQGGTATATVTITVTDPTSAPTIHVANIEMALVPAGKNWKSSATVTIVDQDNQPVAGATVTGDWTFNGDPIGSVSGPTEASGTVLLSSDPVKKATSGTFTFTVTDVVFPGANYNDASNVVTSASKDL